MRGRSEAPKKAIGIGLAITIVMLIIFLISIRIIPAPTPAEILMWIIEFTSIFFMAILGGILVGMYLYHTIWYHGEPEPWEETIYRIYSKLEELEKKLEELEEKVEKLEKEKEEREVFIEDLFFYPCMSSSLEIEKMKERAAKEALEEIEDGKIIGLGSGTTVSYFVRFLASSGKEVKCVASSKEIWDLASKLGLEVLDLNEVKEVEVTVDGADEVDPAGNLIKGYGGALLWEKILASCSKRYVIIVDERKLVRNLGERGKLPTEVIRYGWKKTKEKLEELMKGRASLREKGGRPFVTDSGNYILDIEVKGRIEDPKETSLKLNGIPGVVENGIFCEMADKIIVAFKDGKIKKIEFRELFSESF